MRFWDASAIVPLLIENTRSQSLRSLLRADPIMAIWWVTQTECVSALARLEREGLLHEQSMTAALSRLHELAKNWEEVDPSDAVREAAARFLRVHPLRAADALQMAAAFLAAEGRPSSLELVTLDERLAAAAQKEGFALADIGAA
jgi:predicted nucleic acid-binding protein